MRLLAIACVAGAVCVSGGCRREKPNATHDMRKNQSQYMDEMDKLAKRMEEEEKAKAAQEAGAGEDKGEATEAPKADPEGSDPAKTDPG